MARFLALMARFLALAAACAVAYAQSQPYPHAHACIPPYDAFPFCNTSLPLQSRVDALLSLLNVSEKISLMQDGSAPVPRLGLSLWNWNLEGLHGLGSTCIASHCPTVFPAPPGLGSTWNASLLSSIGSAIGDEVRAMNNANGTRVYAHRPVDPTIWTPSINLNVEPRWGRNPEVYGEDPFHAGTLAAALVRGVQFGNGSSGNGYVKALATTKHYTAYHVETGRFGFDGVVTPHDMLTYLTAWEILATTGHAAGVMCAYPALTLDANASNVPMCANGYLINSVLRGAWGLGLGNGSYVQGDCGAIDFIYSAHHYADNDTQAAGMALNAGTDIDCGGTYTGSLAAAIAGGFTTEAQLDASLSRTFYLQFLTGRFDPLDAQPYTRIPLDVLGCAQHTALSYDAALQAMVLLRNDADLLPLSPGSSIAVIGPFGNYSTPLAGTYYEWVCPGGQGDTSCVPTLLAALNASNGGGAVTYAQGCEVSNATACNFSAALQTALAADIVIIAVGDDGTVGGEGTDRPNIALPGCQLNLTLAVLALGKPAIVVLFTGAQLGIDALASWTGKGSPIAIVNAHYPGNTGAAPVVSQLMGNSNRWGKLTYTMYPVNITDVLVLGSMSLTDAPGRTYKYYTGQPLYPFGFGLSYTTFALNATVARELGNGSSMQVWVSVQNTGARAGDDVVQAYFRPNASSVMANAGDVPVTNDTLAQRILVGFQRVALQPQAIMVLTFNFTVNDLSVASLGGDLVLFPGVHALEFSDGVTSTRVPLHVDAPSPRTVKPYVLAGMGAS